MRTLKIAAAGLVGLGALLALILAARTAADLRDPPTKLAPPASTLDPRGAQILDRHGEPLTTTYLNGWNLHDTVPLHAVPPFLRAAFIAAEDKRFYSHGGVDWRARLSALVTNIRSGRAVRGASTITEQVVRMLHPRPRTLWSRWLEGFEAARLERSFSKDQILELYLNQVPYAANRRGVVQAARHYFARDIGTLSRKEMLALAVLVRAPSRLDLTRNPEASASAIERLADALVESGTLTPSERAAILAEPLELESPRLAIVAPHFIQHVRRRLSPERAADARVLTTLDGRLQTTVQGMLDERIAALRPRKVAHGAVLAADHTTGEVLVWAVAGGAAADGPRTYIDPVTTPRQPGSALKPFLYALALDRGWTAAQVIVDAPLVESTSGGLHSYQNYSRRFYGPVTLRDALGNSLNIPALKTLQYVGAEAYLERLAALGFEGLDEHPDFYGDGIALGSGAVTLLELVQAYAALANGGVFRPLVTIRDPAAAQTRRRVFSAEAASLVANILSDPDARALEFGRDSVLALPLQTATKTGTSSDFRDAWAVGFNYRYVVGVWFGNLDHQPTDGVTGSIGPALLLRSVLAELTRSEATKPLFLSPRLARREVCVPRPDVPSAEGCLVRHEWFLPGTEPVEAAAARAAATSRPRIRRPTPGLQLALDPRLPPASQAFMFEIEGLGDDAEVQWIIDGETRVARGGRYLWDVQRGEHRVAAIVARDHGEALALGEITFSVK
jgi:penicillin-binding protein 1C